MLASALSSKSFSSLLFLVHISHKKHLEEHFRIVTYVHITELTLVWALSRRSFSSLLFFARKSHNLSAMSSCEVSSSLRSHILLKFVARPVHHLCSVVLGCKHRSVRWCWSSSWSFKCRRSFRCCCRCCRSCRRCCCWCSFHNLSISFLWFYRWRFSSFCRWSWGDCCWFIEHKINSFLISEAWPYFRGGRTWLTFNNYNNWTWILHHKSIISFLYRWTQPWRMVWKLGPCLVKVERVQLLRYRI